MGHRQHPFTQNYLVSWTMATDCFGSRAAGHDIIRERLLSGVKRSMLIPHIASHFVIASSNPIAANNLLVTNLLDGLRKLSLVIKTEALHKLEMPLHARPI